MLHILNELLVMMAESDPKELSESMGRIAEETSIEGLEEATLATLFVTITAKNKQMNQKAPLFKMCFPISRNILQKECL